MTLPTTASPPHSPADRDRLEAILQTSLAVGVRVQMSGGYTARVRQTMHRVALGLGADQAETWVSSGSIGLAVHGDDWSRTSVRTTPHIGVNFTELTRLSQLSHRAHTMTVEQVRAELADIAEHPRRYPIQLIMVMLGVSCGAFAVMFGADVVGVLAATVGGTAGACLRHLLMTRRYKPFIYALAGAAVSVSTVMACRGWTATPDIAATASVLYLVPGVPMLNGTADLLTSNYLNGVVRLTRASVILLGSALGMTLALMVWGQL